MSVTRRIPHPPSPLPVTHKRRRMETSSWRVSSVTFIIHSSWSSIDWRSDGRLQVTGERWHLAGDRWHVTGDRWQVTGDRWPVTYDSWQHLHLHQRTIECSAVECHYRCCSALKCCLCYSWEQWRHHFRANTHLQWQNTELVYLWLQKIFQCFLFSWDSGWIHPDWQGIITIAINLLFKGWRVEWLVMND